VIIISILIKIIVIIILAIIVQGSKESVEEICNDLNCGAAVPQHCNSSSWMDMRKMLPFK